MPTLRLPERLARRLPGAEFVRGTLKIVAGTGAAQVLSVLAAPILTRLYPPADYGVYAVATSFLSVFVSVTCLRYEFAIPLPKDDVTAANVLALSALVNGALSVFIAVVLVLFGSTILGVFGAGAMSPYIVLLALAQFGGGLNSALVNWAVRTKDFSSIAIANLAQGIAGNAVPVGLGLLGTGVIGLVIGAVAGNLASVPRLLQTAWRANSEAFKQVTWRGMATVANRYRRFPIFSSGSALLGSVGLRAPLLLIVAFFGTAAGGQYALAERLCYLPVTLVAGAVGQVYIAESARLARERPEELGALFRRTTFSLAKIAIGPAILVAIAAPLFAGLVFGDRWTIAGQFVAVLVPLFYVAFIATATGDVLYVLERQGLHLIREILRFGFLAGSILLARVLGLEPLGAVAVLSAAGSIAYVLYAVISWHAIGTYKPRHGPAAGPGSGPGPGLGPTAEPTEVAQPL
jgi:O-antigen/teichoic acid export membrane protein